MENSKTKNPKIALHKSAITSEEEAKRKLP
jgi:hypothetical protein